MSNRTTHRRANSRQHKKLQAAINTLPGALLDVTVPLTVQPQVCDDCGWSVRSYGHFTECRS